MESKDIYPPSDVHQALLSYAFFWIYLANSFHEQYPFHVSPLPHRHTHNMKMQPYPSHMEIVL